jgi:hypothetical protein
MTPYAIFHNNILTGLDGLHYLWLGMKRKYCGMPQTIHGVKIIFTEYIILRHMTIVANSIAGM